MPTDAEVREASALTRMLILNEPSEIIIDRPGADEDDGAGGKVRGAEPITLDPQQVFVSPVTRDSDYRQSSFAQGDQGESFTNRFVIVGMPDADINQYDTFVWKGHTIKVLFRHPDNGYEVRAEGERVTSGGR